MLHRPLLSIAAAVVIALAGGAARAAANPGTAMIDVQKTTPILLADNVDACLAFWASLGLRAPVTVPEDDGVGFAIIAGDGVEIMYQSFSSARAQRPEAVARVDRSILFLEVSSLDRVIEALSETEIVVPDHVTDYGAREIYVRDPAGNLIGFSQPGQAE